VPYVRELVCRNMESFGISLDKWKNRNVATSAAEVSLPGSEIHILVVRTNEEAAMAKGAYGLLAGKKSEVKATVPKETMPAFHKRENSK